MFKFFNKKDKILKKRTQQLVLEDKEIDIGMTTVSLTFDNKITVIINIHGNYYCDYINGFDEYYVEYDNSYSFSEPKIHFEGITTSINKCNQLLESIGIESLYYIDDLDRNHSVFGKVIEARILETVPFKKMCQVPKIIPVGT